MDRDKRFGNLIRAVRMRVCRMSLREAAQLIDISPPYLSRIEAGREYPPSINVLQKMSEVYKIPLQKLIDRAANRAKEAYGEQIEPSPVLSVFFKFIKEKDLPEERIVEVIKQVCQEKGWNENEFLNEIQKRKKRLPRLLKDGDGLFAADISPRFLSKKMLAEMAYRLLNQLNLGEDTYLPPTKIEVLVEKVKGVRLYYDEKMRVFRNGEPVELGRTHWAPDEDNIREIHINNALIEGEHSSINRLHFTLGHELFHCIEHLALMNEKERMAVAFSRLLAEKEISDSPKIRENAHIERWFKKPNKGSLLLTDEDWREWQADYFAACVLMPEWSVRAEFMKRFGFSVITVTHDENIKQVAYQIARETLCPTGVYKQSLHKLYEVSAQAMAIRLMGLGLVKE